ncbi:MAG TPA: tRNA (guanosine(46)-N7)-methyltransferase TrmB [Verrucomicrobiae bacterium]|nr:tRNA (guanosine(46)-N7)-methyltransferase TrmB [Verrucomicrobiae bacterium]
MIFRPGSYIERLQISELFPTDQPLELELGAGDGSFLIAWAKANPQHNFLGVERLLGRIRKIERKAKRAGLTNVRLMRIEASYFLEYLLPRGSVTALHIYFPDPWPKRKHRKNRLINDALAETCAHVLAPGGTIYLRTDDADYFGQMQSVFKRFIAVPTPPPLAAMLTDFERHFHNRGVGTLAAAYKPDV